MIKEKSFPRNSIFSWRLWSRRKGRVCFTSSGSPARVFSISLCLFFLISPGAVWRLQSGLIGIGWVFWSHCHWIFLQIFLAEAPPRISEWEMKGALWLVNRSSAETSWSFDSCPFGRFAWLKLAISPWFLVRFKLAFTRRWIGKLSANRVKTIPVFRLVLEKSVAILGLHRLI